MPFVRTLAIGAAAAGLLLVSACSSSDAPSASSTSTSAATGGGSSSTALGSGGAITDPSQPIEATVGQEFAIVVESNPTTGYEWTVTGNPADSIAVPIGAAPVTKGSMPGQGGIQTFTFKASGAGTTKITLTYARSFDPEDNPTVQEYTLVVTE